MLTQTTIRDAASIAEDAFVLAYPLVLLNREKARAPRNTLVLARDTPDTLRISAWLDLASGPLVLAVGATHGRYYVLWLRDAWNTVFATLGARTTGTRERSFVLERPGRGRAPRLPGRTRIEAPTRTVRLTGCVEAVDETDEEVRRRVEAGFRLSGGPASAAAPDGRATAVGEVDRMTARAFFAEVARLTGDEAPDRAARFALERLQALGPWRSLAPEVRASVERGVAEGRLAVRAEAERPLGEPAGRWRVHCEPGDALRRAGAARAGTHDDPAEDALSALLDRDAAGLPLSGGHRYVLRFAPDALPPVQGFWSLTTLPRRAHSIGDLHGLTLDADGSLPIYIQHAPPDRWCRSNWLPVPPGAFTLELALLWPGIDALRGRWAPPPVNREWPSVGRRTG